MSAPAAPPVPNAAAPAAEPPAIVRRPPPRLLAETPGLRLWHWPGEEAATLVLFGPARTDPAGAPDWWGRGMAALVGWNTLAFAAKEPAWFPEEEVAGLIAHAQPFMAGPRVAFGITMGGHAALRHGRALAARAALAIAPQPPRPPAGAPPPQRRHPPGRAVLGIAPEDLPELPLLAFDPQLRLDRVQAERLALLPGVRTVRLARTGRSATGGLAETGLLRPLLAAALAGDALRAGAILRGVRRASGLVREAIAASLMQGGRPAWAQALREAAAPSPPAPPWPAQAAAARAAGEREREEALLRCWVAEAPLEVEPRLRLVTRLQAEGRLVEAVVLLQSGLEGGSDASALRAARAEAVRRLVAPAGWDGAAPEGVTAALRLGRALLEERCLDHAAAIFTRVVEAWPETVEAWVGLSDAERLRKRIRPALEAYRRAVAAGADRATIRELRFRLFGEYDG